MKKFCLALTALIILTLCVCSSAMDSALSLGEVIYHQSFDEVSQYSSCGISVGTLGSPDASIYISDGGLNILPFDSSRVYLILPQYEKSDSYTAEFTFKFLNKYNDNAYLAFILTSRGPEPTNITSFVIRANGTVDDFSSVSDEVKKSVAEGNEVSVKIPLEDGVLHEVELSSGGFSCTVERRDVVLVDGGQNGFVIRNADVSISDIYIVNGVGYSEKTGYYASNSYSEVISTDENEPETETELSPATADMNTVLISAAALCAALSAVFKYRIKK